MHEKEASRIKHGWNWIDISLVSVSGGYSTQNQDEFLRYAQQQPFRLEQMYIQPTNNKLRNTKTGVYNSFLIQYYL